MIITKEKFNKINPIVKRMNKIMDSFESNWEEKYDAIFSEDISKVFFETFPNFDYYDPDATYQEDVCAFVGAVNEFWDNIKVV